MMYLVPKRQSFEEASRSTSILSICRCPMARQRSTISGPNSPRLPKDSNGQYRARTSNS
jgi:hypothetical protein